MKYNPCVKKVGESVRTWHQLVNKKKHKTVYDKVEINEALKSAVHEYVEKYGYVPPEITIGVGTYSMLQCETLSKANVQSFSNSVS